MTKEDIQAILDETKADLPTYFETWIESKEDGRYEIRIRHQHHLVVSVSPDRDPEQLRCELRGGIEHMRHWMADHAFDVKDTSDGL
jgi:hypothetical protein